MGKRLYTRKANWFEENFDECQEDKGNKGYEHGIFYYEDKEDIMNDQTPCDVTWFKTEEERDKIFLEGAE